MALGMEETINTGLTRIMLIESRVLLRLTQVIDEAVGIHKSAEAEAHRKRRVGNPVSVRLGTHHIVYSSAAVGDTTKQCIISL